MEHIITAEDIERCRLDNLVRIDLPTIMVEMGACKSKTEAKRLMKQQAVKIFDSEGQHGIIEDVPSEVYIHDGDILKAGRHFFRRFNFDKESDKKN